MTLSNNASDYRPKPELLMPAGSLEKLKYAYAFGADAVYVGIPIFSLRARENEFDISSLLEAKKIAKSQNKKIYFTVNIFSKNRKINTFKENISRLVELEPDALIMGDPGLMLIAREKFPDLNIHLSVQANCMNWESVRFWKNSLNISRIILSRELHINDIKEIKQRVPDIELEAFVHGSICIAYSGRCMMSSYMSHRDANQGVCDNSCREKYKVFAHKKDGDDYFIEDQRDPGKFYQITEDESGSYLMNAKDLRLIQYLKEIYDAGVCSFKVEGRTKSINYVSIVAKTYRTAIDDFMNGKSFDEKLLSDLEKIAHRGYDTGFMINEKLGSTSQNYDTSVPRKYTQQFAGILLQDDPKTPDGYFAINIRNKLKVGDSCELISPSKENFESNIESILNKDLTPVTAAHGGSGTFFVKFNKKLSSNFGILSLKKND